MPSKSKPKPPTLKRLVGKDDIFIMSKAEPLIQEFRAMFAPIVDEWAKRGYSIRDIRDVLSDEFNAHLDRAYIEAWCRHVKSTVSKRESTDAK